MSDLRAPRALRSPISRMRSVTFVSIMFMMPMPPTTSEMDATDVMSSWNVNMTELKLSIMDFMDETNRPFSTSSSLMW